MSVMYGIINFIYGVFIVAKLKDAGIYVPKENEQVSVGMTTTSKVPEKLSNKMKSKESKENRNHED